MKNWLTTLFGAMAAVPQILQVTGVGHFGHVGAGSVDGLIGIAGIAGLGLVAKQFNVTGGTVAATDEAEKRIQK